MATVFLSPQVGAAGFRIRMMGGEGERESGEADGWMDDGARIEYDRVWNGTDGVREKKTKMGFCI